MAPRPAFRSRALRCVLVLLALLCGADVAEAQEARRIVWPYFSFPPQVIVRPDGSLSGASIRLREFLARALQDYRHERIHSPVNRTLREVREGNPYCLTGLLKRPDREALLRYSDAPSRLVPPPVLVAERGVLAPYRDAEGRVSLRRLFGESGLTCGHIKGFSHGPVLDAILAENDRRANFFEIVDMKSLNRQLELLLSGRIQYFLGTPDQVWYAFREEGLADRLEVVPVAEDQSWELGYVACEKGEWSREVVERIDRVLREALRDGTLKSIYRPLMPPALLTEFDAAWERLMLPFAATSVSE